MRHQSLTVRHIQALRLVNWAAVADLLHVDSSAIYHTLAGRRKNPYLRRAIAIAAGLKPEALWPDLAKKPTRGKPWAA